MTPRPVCRSCGKSTRTFARPDYCADCAASLDRFRGRFGADAPGARIPCKAEVEAAEAFLQANKSHSCYICRDGYADCGTIRDAEQADAVIEAYKAEQALHEADFWPLLAPSCEWCEKVLYPDRTRPKGDQYCSFRCEMADARDARETDARIIEL